MKLVKDFTNNPVLLSFALDWSRVDEFFNSLPTPCNIIKLKLLAQRIPSPPPIERRSTTDPILTAAQTRFRTTGARVRGVGVLSGNPKTDWRRSSAKRNKRQRTNAVSRQKSKARARCPPPYPYRQLSRVRDSLMTCL